MSKPWKNNLSYEEIITPLIDIAREYLKLSKKYNKGIKYEGIGFHYCALAMHPQDQLNKSGIEYHKGQNRDLFEILFHIAFLYGFSQCEAKYAEDEAHNFLKVNVGKIVKENEALAEENKELKAKISELKGTLDRAQEMILDISPRDPIRP